MKKKNLLGIGIALVSLTLSVAVNAATIVDTGPMGTSSRYWTLASDATAVPPSTGQWLATQFILNANYFITDIAGYVRSVDQVGQTFTISVYASGGGLPAPNNLLYSNGVTVAGDSSADYSWEGYHIGFGNGLALDAGSYWLSFEVRDPNGGTYAGGMPDSATNPLQVYAANPDGNWYNSANLGLGVRISGDLAPVPLPPALWLFASALAGFGIIGGKKRNSQVSSQFLDAATT